MKILLFILFFPITVPTYLLCKFAIWFFQWFGETFIPFLLNKVFPAIKRFIQEQSTKMEENAEKLKQEREKEKLTILKSNQNIHIEDTFDETEEFSLEASVSVNTSSTSNVDPKLEERVFILFYSVGTAKRYMRDCTNPDVFF